MNGMGFQNAIGLCILAYATYGIICHFISIFKYKAQIVKVPSAHALKNFWRTGDDIWWCAMVIMILLFGLGLVLVNFFGLIDGHWFGKHFIDQGA